MFSVLDGSVGAFGVYLIVRSSLHIFCRYEVAVKKLVPSKNCPYFAFPEFLNKTVKLYIAFLSAMTR